MFKLTAAAVMAAFCCSAAAVDKVPVLLYHSRTCDNIEALSRDLRTMHEAGFTVVPTYHVVLWRLGLLQLPDKPVAITIDDGYDRDYLSHVPGCNDPESALDALRSFNEEFGVPVHASLFVIGSRAARTAINEEHFNDNWWAAAQNSPYMEVYNHGIDHDHTNIKERLYDKWLDIDLPAGAHADGDWFGKLWFHRINNYVSADMQVRISAQYIAGKIGVWPDLFAYPMGHASFYLMHEYFPKFWHEHRTTAAFCIESGPPGAIPGNYVTRSSNRWCLPRLTYGYSWKDTKGLINILDGAIR